MMLLKEVMRIRVRDHRRRNLDLVHGSLIMLNCILIIVM